MVDRNLASQANGLWPEALARAQRACAGTLARLKRGDGGFYEADDLLQDLYCAWVELCQAHSDVSALWRAWSGLLYAGGRQLLRRAPQRLWDAPETRLVEPHLLPDDAPDPASDAGSRWADVADALWRLPTHHRQLLYWRTLCGLSARQVALRLRDKPALIDTRLHRARRALRDILQEQETSP